jgi:hypothetical protein
MHQDPRASNSERAPGSLCGKKGTHIRVIHRVCVATLSQGMRMMRSKCCVW